MQRPAPASSMIIGCCHNTCWLSNGLKMPLTEAGEVHHRRLALPDGVGAETPLWTIRYTGECFTSYE